MLPAIGAAIGILTIMSLATFAAGSVYPSPAYVESTITVKEREMPCDVPVIDADLVVKDQAGNVITETTVGTQVLIEGTITMDCIDYLDDSRITLFEVRTKEGITTFLAWQKILGDWAGK